MLETAEPLPVDQLKEYLLSNEFQHKLAQDIWGDDSFGLGKSERELPVVAEHFNRFPDLSYLFDSKGDINPDNFGKRIASHLARLTDPKRTIQENYFGLLCMYYGLDNEGYPRLPSVAAGQFDDTTFFWSLSPYLAQELRYYGLPPSRVVETIFKWGKSAKGERHLAGVSEYLDLNAFRASGFILTKNPEGYSHEFAKGIARILCGNTAVFKEAITKENPLYSRDITNPLNLLDETGSQKKIFGQ